MALCVYACVCAAVLKYWGLLLAELIGIVCLCVAAAVPKYWGLLMAKLIGTKAADKLLLTGKLISPAEVCCRGVCPCGVCVFVHVCAFGLLPWCVPVVCAAVETRCLATLLYFGQSSWPLAEAYGCCMAMECSQLLGGAWTLWHLGVWAALFIRGQRVSSLQVVGTGTYEGEGVVAWRHL
eukprot:1157881-Pelagomonas_calceolata.AAC.5